MYELAIIIINYKTPQMTVDCLTTLLPEIRGTSSSVVIVDNNSADESIDIIQNWLSIHDKESKVNLISSPDNLGFSGGNNLGINSVDSKYYLLLNSDTLIIQGSISKLVKTALEHKDAGLITPKLEWPNTNPQISCFNNLSPISEFISSAKTGFFTKLLNQYNIPIPLSEEITYPKWSSFACVLIKKEVFDDIGLMNDGYFMYFEDAEFCYRANKAGWVTLNQPSSRVVHLRGGSSPVKENTKLKKRLPRYYYESRARYFYQLYGWIGLTLANVLWSTGRLLSKIRQIFGRNDKAISEKQWLDIWTNWLNPLKNYTHPGSKK
ncbi:MAG: glycosyltransferase family 2 protein, partial [Candidatus Marithrix sp.]